MTNFFISKVLPFRDLEDQPLFQRQNFFPETFDNLIVAFLNFDSLQMLYLFLFPPVSACVLTQPCILQSRTQPSTHNSSVHSLAHATRAVGLLAPPTRGRGWCPIGGASCWRRWTWLPSTESRHSYTMGPFTHMSDSVADWGRGTWRVAPSRVGGPQNCDGLWFISVHNYSYIHFLISYFWMSLVLPGQTSSFCCHLK